MENKKFYDFKKYYFLEFLIYLLPISIVIGNSAINILTFIISTIYLLLILNKKIDYKEYKKFNLIFLCLSILFLINIFFSIDQHYSIIKFLGIVKYYLLMMAILFCLEKINHFCEFFLKILFLLLIIVGIDTLIQFFFGEDILGYKVLESHGRRLSGPFGDEYVVGAFISKLIFIAILLFKDIKFRFYNILILTLFFIIVILTNERAASVMFCITLVFYFILNPNFSIRKKIFKLFFLLLLLISIFNINPQLKKHFIERTFDQIGITKNNPEYLHNSFWDSQWGAHYLTAIEIFKNRPLLGSGIDTFRFECKKKEYEKINSVEYQNRCNTHPHNIYLEILSETGIFIFISFVFFNIYIFLKLAKNYFHKKKYSHEILINLCSYFILFNPLQTTGSFFSTWNGVFYWIIIAFSFYIIRKLENQ